jgi:integrase
MIHYRRYQERGFKTKREALDREVEIRREVREGTYHNPRAKKPAPAPPPLETPSEMTLKEFWPEFMEIQEKDYGNSRSELIAKASAWRCHLKAFFGDMPLKEIRYRQVKLWVRTVDHLKTKSKNNYIDILRKALKEAYKLELIDDMPYIPALRKRREEKPELKPLTYEEANALIQSADKEISFPIFLALTLGLRFGELIALEKSDIDFERRTITIRHNRVRGESKTPKSGKERVIGIDATLVMMLRSHMATRVRVKTELLFSRRNGSYIEYKDWYLPLVNAFKAAGIKKGPQAWHRLRRSFATHLAWQDETLFRVQQLMGHSTVKMTEQYIGNLDAHDDRSTHKLTVLYSDAVTAPLLQERKLTRK